MGFMDTLARIPKILEANINDMLDKCEDPEKMINQMLVDYGRNLAEVKKATVDVMADMKLAESKLRECERDIAERQRAAEAALRAGNDGDARALLASKQKMEVTRQTLEKNYNVCVNNANQMKAAYNKLENDIESLKQRADVAKAQLKIADAQQKIHKVSDMSKSSKIEDSFAKYEEKAERALARANAATELDEQVETSEQILAKYASSGGDTAVDAELAQLKAQMGL